MEAQAVSLTIDSGKCTFCRACELACSFTKEGIFASSFSRIQILQIYEHGVNVPIVCINCAEAPCIDSCPSDAISREGELGVVQIDEMICTACGECVEVCPYGAITMPDGVDVAIMCDLCEGDPECVHSCLYGALTFERKPDEVFSSMEWDEDVQPLDEKRWSLATRIAERVRGQREVEV